MATALRQHKVFTSNSSGSTSWTATLDSAPLEGSLLVAALGFIGWSSATKSVAVDAPFTLVQGDVNGSAGVAAAARLAGASEGASVTFTMGSGDSSDSTAMVFMEFTGDFDAASVSQAINELDALGGLSATSRQCPPINIGSETHLVVPLLGMGGPSSDPSINLNHNFVAHARPGSLSWHRTIATAWREVTDDATHAPTWSWTDERSVLTIGQLAFPLAGTAGVAVEIEYAEETRAVELGWTDNEDGPFKVVRDGSVIESGITGTSYLDTNVATGKSYIYRIRDDNDVQSDPVTVSVTSRGVFFLRRDGSGWSAEGGS